MKKGVSEERCVEGKGGKRIGTNREEGRARKERFREKKR